MSCLSSVLTRIIPEEFQPFRSIWKHLGGSKGKRTTMTEGLLVDFWFALKPCNSYGLTLLLNHLLLVSLSQWRSYPWLVRLQQRKVVAAGRALPSMPKASDVEVGNYLRKLWSCQGRFQPCRSAYCDTCFEPHEFDMFEVKLPQDFNGASLAEVWSRSEIRFRVARPGDHMCTSFQCPNCQCQIYNG